MRLASTTSPSKQALWREAVLRGIAPDGGLYVPVTLPFFDTRTRAEVRDLPFAEFATRIVSAFIDDELTSPEIRHLCHESFNFDAPLVRLDDTTQVLELFHGPTCAFKDFGARFMARLFRHFWGVQDRPLTVLVATSGDTGSAVAQAFYDTSDAPPIRVAVLFPRGKVSEVQRKQMTTLGHNVTAFEVDGTFDDCQALVKRALRDDSILNHTALTSANSINIARLLPQMLYYAYVLARAEHPPIVVVPCGNLGNLTGGLMAHRSGFEARHWIAACNSNRVFPEFLSSGRFAPAASTETISNAMDVGNPSNFSRITALYGDAPSRELLSGFSVSDEDTLHEMSLSHAETGYILDPHTAVAARALRAHRARYAQRDPAILISTAHPAKFADVVRRAIDLSPSTPPQLAQALSKTELSKPLPNSYEALARSLQTLR